MRRYDCWDEGILGCVLGRVVAREEEVKGHVDNSNTKGVDDDRGRDEGRMGTDDSSYVDNLALK